MSQFSDSTNLKRCPGYSQLRTDGVFSPSCGYVWDSSPAPHGDGALCPKCWHKPSRSGKRIIMLDGSESKVPEALVNLHDESKVVVDEQRLVTEKGQDWDEAEWDVKMKRKKKEKPTWARWGKK